MKKILVVDDEEMIRMSLERELSEAGYAVLTAENGKQGVQIAQEQNLDLILLDIMMPEMNGVETIDFLKKNRQTKNIPIIFMTNLVEEGDVNNGFVKGSKGIDQYFIAKPFDMDEVFKLVHASIGKP